MERIRVGSFVGFFPIGSLGKESAIYHPVSEGGREASRATS